MIIDGVQPSYKRTNIFQVRLTTPELEEIKNKARERGFETISDFFRYTVLSYNMNLEMKINDTNNKVKEILKIIKEKS